MRAFLSRLIDPLLRRSRERRLSDEVQQHLDLLTDEFVARGLSIDEARLAARQQFGGVDQTKERYRDQRGFRLADELSQDVRFALRLIARDRWVTAATIVALALGIGAAGTMVTLIYGMNFRELPFREARQLVGISGEPTPSLGGQVRLAVFDAWRSASRSFQAIGAEADGPVNIGDETLATDRFSGTFVSHNLFSLLGERPIAGRDFSAEDDRAGAAPVIVIGYRMWVDRYGADASAIGRSVRINGEAATIIGVMPEGFLYPIESQVWRPLRAIPAPALAERPLRVIGRLAAGSTSEQAREELNAILSTSTTLAETDRTRRTIVRPLNETYVGRPTEPVPMMALAAVLVVLLIACSHGASLLLARSAARSREMSLRTALGAGRGRLVRQLLVESIMTALLAGLLGAAMAAAAARVFANEVTGFGLPYWTRFTFDGPLVSVITLLCIGAGVTFGLLPALHQSAVNLNDVLNQGGRSGMASPRAQRTTTILLIGEFALTMVLLSVASALVRSADVVYRADHTIDLSNLWEYRLSLPQPQYADADRRRLFYSRLEQSLMAMPEIPAITFANAAPFVARDSRGIVLDGESPAQGNPARSARLVAIGDRYFDTLGLTVVRGRGFEDLDAGTRAGAALVNQRFVDRYMRGTEAIGRQVLLVNERAPDTPPARVTIVGIAPPLRQQIAAGHTPVVYVPFDTQSGTTASIIVRGSPEQFAAPLRRALSRIDPDLPLFNLQSLERVSYSSRWIQRITSTVFSIVAIIATLLSALGLYALTAYAASQRTQEVGVRMALGAQRSQVSWLFLGRALRNVGVGLSIGLAGAFAAGTLLQGTLVDVTANNPLSLSAVAIFLIAISIAAALLPASRASRLDPVAALRQD